MKPKKAAGLCLYDTGGMNSVAAILVVVNSISRAQSTQLPQKQDQILVG